MELAVPTSQSLDIVLLRTFLEVVDSGGFALAADNLALTPPQSAGISSAWNRQPASACSAAPLAAWS